MKADLLRHTPVKIEIMDTTLRDGEQTSGVSTPIPTLSRVPTR